MRGGPPAPPGFGNVVHAIAERVALGDDPGPSRRPRRARWAEVDGVWAQLYFRTPWSADREHDRVRAALGAVPRLARARTRVEAVASRPDFSAEVVLPDGERVLLAAAPTGWRSTPTAGWSSSTSRPAVPPHRTGDGRHPQLGLYQYAVDAGRVRSRPRLRRRRAVPSSCSCGLTDGGNTAKVQAQDAQHDGDPRRAALRLEMERPSAVVRKESFPASRASNAASARSCRSARSRAPGR